MSYYSRLQRRNERLTIRQSYFLVAVSVVILIIFIVYGFPAILNLAGTVGNMSGKKTASTSAGPTVTPSTPRFSENFTATKSAQITLSGAADSKVTVEIFQNDQSLGTTVAGDDGSFSMDVNLNKGDNVFTAWAISESGAKSPKSDPYTITFSASPPKLEITSPHDGDSLSDSRVTIQGNSDPDTAVTVNDHQAISQSDGSFDYNFNLSHGDNKIKVVATDAAGNQTTQEITVKYNP